MSRPPSSNIMNDTRYQTPSSTTTSNTQSQVIIIKNKKNTFKYKLYKFN
jgi:hypothetical protein